jgi:2-polyprenyl-6-methoxyphenol hydroxylase-like FAD-dependent oxidoreductase
MRQTDIAIVGGGLAGSIAAAMLGRDGCEVVLIDPHTVYPPDFRCEKLDPGQVLLLEKTGLAGPVLRATTRDEHVWVARFGRLVEKRRNNQYDFLYDTLVNKVRAEIPIGVDRIRAKVLSIATSSERQQLKLSTGAEVSARLVVLANGLNIGLRHSLGLEREVLSACHSISIGFDMRPIGRPSFDFRALTYYSERITDRVAYLALFPIGSAMRANFFIYRNLDDPWLQEFREAPASTLLRSLPGLRKLTGDFEIADPVRIRPVDLYRTTGYQQPGIVVVGDAFATSCPAAGTGASKVLTDAERLCHVHIPRWLA